MSEPTAPVPGTAPAAKHPPPSASGRWGAWLEIVRAGNLPTVVSNALVGWAIGTRAAPDHRFLLSVLAVMALYAAGMIFNDVCDARIDARERPSRPIPSGRIEAHRAVVVVGGLFAAALGLLALTTSAAAATGGVLIALIVAYDLLHARSALAVILMAACRMMTYVVVGSAAPVPGGWPLPMPMAAVFAASLGAFVVGLSLVARLEAGEARRLAGPRRMAPLLLVLPPFVPLAVAVVLAAWTSRAGSPPPSFQATWLAPLGALTAAWILLGARHVLATPPRRGRAVGMWIAAIALLDACFLAVLDRPGLACAAVGCWVATVLAQRRLAAT